jgi:hypothetical protein
LTSYYIGTVDAVEGRHVRVSVGVVSEEFARLRQAMAEVAADLIVRYSCHIVFTISACKFGQEARVIFGPRMFDMRGEAVAS